MEPFFILTQSDQLLFTFSRCSICSQSPKRTGKGDLLHPTSRIKKMMDLNFISYIKTQSIQQSLGQRLNINLVTLPQKKIKPRCFHQGFISTLNIYMNKKRYYNFSPCWDISSPASSSSALTRIGVIRFTTLSSTQVPINTNTITIAIAIR